MTIAIASGKGGTGKTSLSVALSRAAAQRTASRQTSPAACLLDCDVEEPNAAIFFAKGSAGNAGAAGITGAGANSAPGPESGSDAPSLPDPLENPVEVPVPEVDPAKCTACGKCVKACRFNAIALLKTTLMIFPELCHSCGGCVLACPAGALEEKPRRIGLVRGWKLDKKGRLLPPSGGNTPGGNTAGGNTAPGNTAALDLTEGLLDVGRAMSPPVIRAVKKTATQPAGTARTAGNELVLIDCPPGTSCPMVTAVRDADYVIFVTEPTPFGLHDLSLAVDTARTMGLSFGVVVNRAGEDKRVDEYCRKEGITLLASLPEDRRIAEAYSRGASMYEAGAQWQERIDRLLEALETAAKAAIIAGTGAPKQAATRTQHAQSPGEPSA